MNSSKQLVFAGAPRVSCRLDQVLLIILLIPVIHQGERSMKSRGKSLCMLSAGVMLGSASPLVAMAQEQITTVEEITVTAQRREESLQDTPIAITAFSKRQLETQRVENVMDLLNQVPSVNIAPWAGSRVAPNLFIRGMGNLNTVDQ
ncbi:MAG: TonB-dependent receptor plug domain-containing protein [Gammaproteobacteria bacterium]|nr:TonB-dependent receptor plug domain-containing protein [Gammaproteobacteria bacterium]